MYRYLAIVLLSFCLCPVLEGQVLDGSFRFEDGFYNTHESLLNNIPDVYPDSSRFSFINSGSAGILFASLTGEELVNLDYFTSVLYIVEKGRVYINANENINGLHRFVLLSVQGKIGLFEREFEEQVSVPMNAYNPLNGQPFIKGEVEKTIRKKIPFLLFFETGQVLPFTYRNFLGMIVDDEDLVNQVKEIDSEDRIDKLYRCLLIYNDRNSFVMKNNNE
jgi:hypothetical protein